jgi:hypothetical protein
MTEKVTVTGKKILEIDVSNIEKGTCKIVSSGSTHYPEFVVCEDEGKLKIYPVKKER